jgi:type III secretory pathway component EscS
MDFIATGLQQVTDVEDDSLAFSLSILVAMVTFAATRNIE